MRTSLGALLLIVASAYTWAGSGQTGEQPMNKIPPMAVNNTQKNTPEQVGHTERTNCRMVCDGPDDPKTHVCGSGFKQVCD